jgi:UDP-glucuronate 4-epimerase
MSDTVIKVENLSKKYLIHHQQKERYIEVLEQCLGKKAEKNLLPIQAGDVPATYADVDDLMNDVGFKPATTIEEGIQKFVEWYKGYYKY